MKLYVQWMDKGRVNRIRAKREVRTKLTAKWQKVEQRQSQIE